MTTNTQHTFRPRFYCDVVDDQAKHDLKWVGVWATTTLIFALIGYFGRSAWWIAALVSGAFLYFYGIATLRGGTESQKVTAMTNRTHSGSPARQRSARHKKRARWVWRADLEAQVPGYKKTCLPPTSTSGRLT